jgi:hypothetical protein
MSASQHRKSVLISGCSLGGIGDALAKLLLKKGLRVFATARDFSSPFGIKVVSVTAGALPMNLHDIPSDRGVGEERAYVQIGEMIERYATTAKRTRTEISNEVFAWMVVWKVVPSISLRV